jgi:hypothetical protein
MVALGAPTHLPVDVVSAPGTDRAAKDRHVGLFTMRAAMDDHGGNPIDPAKVNLTR